MVFSSLLFLFRFLPLVFILYYAAPIRVRNVILFLFSLFFYAWGEPKYVFLMLFSITMDYTVGRLIHKAKRENRPRRAKICLLFSVCMNLGILGFFKYADFLLSTVNDLTGLNLPLLNIPLPIGISFFTFQTMSYTIDVYRETTEVQTSWVNYGTYVSMFPQLIAGPIVQYKTIAAQMRKRRESADNFAAGIHRFVVGVGKKVLLANNIGLLWDFVAGLPIGEVPVATAWLGALAFTFQIYFDFSGYSDMAIGLGKMFGFHFLENFDYPYTAQSVTEFWRRWHISLSSWFKEYVYIPLGGNRRGKLRQIRNIFVVWMLTGIWHGAHWNYVLWGIYYGILLVLEKLVLKPVLEKMPGIVRNFYTMFWVILSWVIFKCEDLGYCASYIKAMFGGFSAGFVNGDFLYLVRGYGFLLVILILGSTKVPQKCAVKLERSLGENGMGMTFIKGGFCLAVLFLSVAYLVDATYNPFLYFRF